MNNRMTHLASQGYVKNASMQLLFCVRKDTHMEIDGRKVAIHFHNEVMGCRCHGLEDDNGDPIPGCDPQARAMMQGEEP